MQDEPVSLERFRIEVAEDLLTLAVLHDRELDRDRIMALWDGCYSEFLGLRLNSERGRESLSGFRKGLTDIPTSLDQQTLDILAAEYADIYLNNSFGASPCESVWIDDDHLLMQEPMFQIREHYQKHGLEVQNWRMRTDDHLVHQLHFISHLLEDDSREENLELAARFMDEHILRWIGDFADRVSARCATGFYDGLAQLTAAYLEELRDILAELLGQPRPSREEIEERMKPKVAVQVQGPQPYVPGTAPSW
jgi:TorA maturation chaperone TorD